MKKIIYVHKKDLKENMRYYCMIFIPMLLYFVIFIIPNVKTRLYSFFECRNI